MVRTADGTYGTYDLIEDLCEEYEELSFVGAEAIVNSMFRSLGAAVRRGDNLRLPHLFTAKKRVRKRYNKHTGETNYYYAHYLRWTDAIRAGLRQLRPTEEEIESYEKALSIRHHKTKQLEERRRTGSYL